MLPRLDQRLLVLVLGLELLLAGDVRDVPNNEQLAVHVAKLARLDAHFEQDVLLVHHCANRAGLVPRTHRKVLLLLDLLVLRVLQNLEEAAPLPTLAKKVAKTQLLALLFRQLTLLRVVLRVEALLLHDLLGLEDERRNGLLLQSLLRLKLVPLRRAEEPLQMRVHEEDVNADRFLHIVIVFGAVRRTIGSL